MQQHTAPTPPTFRLRKLRFVAYAMSVATSAVGQILFLGAAFGGGWWHLPAAGLAGFAEFVMASAGDASLEHRVNRRAWKAMLAVAVGVACYGASMQLLHFWPKNTALAATFCGASLAGFLLHIVDGHIVAAAYLRDLAVWEKQQAQQPVVPAPRPEKQVEPVHATAERVAEPTVPVRVAVAKPAPEVAAAEPKPLPAPSNVTPIQQGTSARQRAYAYLVEQVTQHGRPLMGVTGRELAEKFDTPSLANKISDLRKTFRQEFPDHAAVVNQ